MPGPVAPSEEAIALLRDQARQLDVEDLVDLCYARASESLRTSVYLEALRGRPGEQAQVAACLLCFDLARRGDERREAEVQFLLPTLEHLFASSTEGLPPRSVQGLIDKSVVVADLWQALADHASRRDPRMHDAMPELEVEAMVELDLFDADEIAELEVGLDDFDVDLIVDDAALAAFDGGLNRLIPPPPAALFSSDNGRDIDRLERLRDHCASYAAPVPAAAGLHAMTQLFLATHTRAVGLFGRRNKRRDRALVEGLTAFLSLPSPPAEAAAWFAASDVPGAEPQAWTKLAELLLDVAAQVGAEGERQHGGRPAAAGPSPRAPKVTRS
ncbi:MAG: hypothetical protein FJ137_10850, partial [Deltaproteobacteria bacterium]|nr:hypothetical protein [Deltaproteobacteria bacterium]